jgi:periplasmic protein TonB
MQHSLPKYLSGHFLAFTGMIALHAGILVWLMIPESPVVISQQQIIQVTMVAPTTFKQEAAEATKNIPQVVNIETKEIPKEVGMIKIEEPKKEIINEEPKKEEVSKEEANPEQEQLTTGMQSVDALAEASAIIKPSPAGYLKNPPPEYPNSARKRNQQGTVMLYVLVSKEGAPISIKVEKSSGHASLDESALRAVKEWKFIPARRGSSPVEASVIVPIKFQINQS